MAGCRWAWPAGRGGGGLRPHSAPAQSRCSTCRPSTRTPSPSPAVGPASSGVAAGAPIADHRKGINLSAGERNGSLTNMPG